MPVDATLPIAALPTLVTAAILHFLEVHNYKKEMLSNTNPHKRIQEFITHLFMGKDMIIEVLLQLLVGKVDAKLLKAIELEVLKTKNIQEAQAHKLCSKHMDTNKTDCITTRKDRADMSASLTQITRSI